MFKKIPRTHLSDAKMHALLTEWVYGTQARVAAHKLGINTKTVDLWYGAIRERLAALPDPPPFSGTVEIDESYFGEKRPWVKGTGTADRVPIFGMRSRETGKVWATVVTGTNHTFLLPIIQRMVLPGSTILSDGFGAYRHLPELGYTHYVVLHEHTYVTEFGIHTNGIESFWRHAKDLFRTRRGLPRERYSLHLAEAVFRFNNPDKRELRLIIRKILHS